MWHQILRGSDSEKAITFQFKFGVFAHHPLSAPDRLGNPDLPFPIGILYGEHDYFGSDGADFIVRNNRHFKDGNSQLFKLKNSDHLTYFDNPEDL
jgi:pimeloyl-ACP methyl ester carboxylesterase